MPKRFVFIRERKLGKEIIWEYSGGIVFNGKKIARLTITDHFRLKHGEVITRKLICSLVRRLNRRRMEPEPQQNPSNRNVFVRNGISYRAKKYRLIFWFKDGTTNHLWIRNCHPQD